MTEATFDTGALVRLQRDDHVLRQVLRVAEQDAIALVTSAAALTEFLGPSPRALRGRADWICSLFQVGTVDETLARRSATLMRAALDMSPSSPSPIDSLVAAEAERRGSVLVIDGDRADFDALASVSGQIRIVDVGEWIG